MLFQSSIFTCAALALSCVSAIPHEPAQQPVTLTSPSDGDRNLSPSLFASLEELSRIVDITYCVGVTGIYHPFTCAGRCSEFPNFELVETWNTGPLMSDSCGYIAIDHGHKGESQGHGKGKGRIIVAFRGTYSLANTIADLTTIPQEYVPYPSDPEEPANPPSAKESQSLKDHLLWPFRYSHLATRLPERTSGNEDRDDKCLNCTVHTGFYTSYTHTRPLVIPHLQGLKEKNPEYELHLVGHSLGGAVAALLGLECEALGWDPTITTFGEPRIGNKALNTFLDQRFGLGDNTTINLHGKYRRVTHVDDPVPLLPLSEWGYRMHAGEIYVSKPELSPTINDLILCRGDEDRKCIADGDVNEELYVVLKKAADLTVKSLHNAEDAVLKDGGEAELEARWGFSSRYKLWQILFAHRDYFWRLGLCVPGGDPLNWGREKYPDAEMPGDGEL